MTSEQKKWIFEEWLAAYGSKLHEITIKKISVTEPQNSVEPVKEPGKEDFSSR